MHEKFPDDRNTGLEYMKSALAHVCDRHTHFEKIPFLKGISGCLHHDLSEESKSHKIDRKSNEFALLKHALLKPSFTKSFLRAAPKMNTSPCENFNSVLNLYAPKTIASSQVAYDEKVKLAVMHHNTLAMAEVVGVRTEKSSYQTNAKGREAKCVKRKKDEVPHEWRDE
ncbi:hypothetical protein PMAYCL1PPCAC_05536, partial [Pristionchus mayeri]